MKKIADDYYLFYLPLKYGGEHINVKSINFLNLLALASFPVMFFYIKNLSLQEMPIPLALTIIIIFFCIILFSLVVSFFIKKTTLYEPTIYFASSLSVLQLAYMLIVVGYASFLSKYIANNNSVLIFTSFLAIPLLIICISAIRYHKLIKSGNANKHNEKVILLEKKYDGETTLIDGKKIVVYGTFIGVATTSFFTKNPFLFFILILISVCAIPVAVTKFFILSYIKLKFPEQYSEKNLEKIV